MRNATSKSSVRSRLVALVSGAGLVVTAAFAQQSNETDIRKQIAVTNMNDAVVIDCQLPGKLRKLGGTKTYLTPGQLIRLPAIDCRSRGGEYTIGNLASGTLSLTRWMEPAEKGDAEAQYYVARIYANGMDNVPTDYRQAAIWYQKASDQGHDEAMQELGYLYEQGLGVEKDPLKALNLQREASGLGEDLDYAYKVAEAEQLAADLASKLTAAHGSLRDSQLQAQQAEGNLAVAQAEIRRLELQTTALVADLNTARQMASGPDSPKVKELEFELATTKSALQESQSAAIALEKERQSVEAKLALQLLAGQAAQLELRELVARTEAAESRSDSLAVQLAESQQRLIESDQELNQLQMAYREDSDRLSAETARLTEARARSDSDAAAYIAAREAEIATKSARVSSLEAEVQTLKAQLARAMDDTTETELRSELASLQAKFDTEVSELQRSREQVAASHTQSEQQLTAMYAESQRRLESAARELDARKRRIDSLMAETDDLRVRVGELVGRSEAAEGRSESLAAQLAASQQQLAASDQKLSQLQVSYDAQSEHLSAETARWTEARAKSDSDAATYIAAREAEVAAQAARVSSLESEVQMLQAQLEKANDDTRETALRAELASLQATSKQEVDELQRAREELEATHSKNEQQLTALYADSQRQLESREKDLDASKLQINSLQAETAELRLRIGDLEAEKDRLARASGLQVNQLQAQLRVSREQAASRRTELQQLLVEKSAVEAQLARNRELQGKIAAGKVADDTEIELLKAQIEAGKSTINAQNLRIASLEKDLQERNVEISNLKAQLDEPEPLPIEVRDALAVLDLARSQDEMNLGEYHALLIANQEYQNLEDLETPIKDVLEIQILLQSEYGFQVEVLQNATNDQIMHALYDYKDKLQPEDNLLIYYAGRGSTPDGPPDRAYWLGVDADPKRRTGLLLAEHVSETIAEFDAKRILIVTDSCFSKRRLRENSLSVGRGLAPERFKMLVQFTSRNVLTSGANVPIYDEAGNRPHSLFAGYFLEILRRNGNVLSGEMLAFQMAQRIREDVDDPQRATPTYNVLQGTGHKAGDFFFVPSLEPTLVADASLTNTGRNAEL